MSTITHRCAEDICAQATAKACRAAMSRMERFLRQSDYDHSPRHDIKVLPNGNIKVRAHDDIRVSYSVGRRRHMSLAAMISVSQEKGMRIRMERRDLFRARAVHEGCSAAHDLASGIGPKSSRRTNLQRAAVAGVIIGGVALAAAIMGPEAAGKLTAYGSYALNTPAVLQVFSVASDIGSRAMACGPDILEAFRHGMTLGAARIAEMGGATAEYLRDFSSPALSWLSSQRGEIASAVRGSVDMAASLWAEIAPKNFLDGVTKSFGAFGGAVAFVQSVEYVREKLFGKKAEKAKEPPQVVHHHHHHHHHVQTTPEEAEKKALDKVSELSGPDDPNP